MINFAVGVFSGAVGTLLYTRFFSDAHQFDWDRALYVGLATGVVGEIFRWAGRKKGTRNKAPH